MKRTFVATTGALALAASALAFTPVSTSAAQVAAAATTTPTKFAMTATGYGTKVKGGDIPAGSDRSAYQHIGCTNQAGLNKNNSAVGVDLGSGAVADVIKTRTWTTQKNGVVSSRARNYIANVTLGSGPTAVVINGIESYSRAYHNSSGFHTETRTNLASLTVGGVLTPVPTQGTPVTIPGLTIALGQRVEKSSSSGALAKADTLRITLRTGSINLAHSKATIDGGVKSGLFRGSAYGAKVEAVDDLVRTGKIPFVIMPCQGTDGNVLTNDTAQVDPQGLVLKGLSAKAKGDQTKSSADAYTQGRVGRVNIGTGSIVVKAVVGRANVHYADGKGITRNIKGSSLGALIINGEEQTFPESDTIDVPGVALFERNVVHRTKTSIEVTALRITLASGSLAVINLGHAKVGFHESGL